MMFEEIIKEATTSPPLARFMKNKDTGNHVVTGTNDFIQVIKNKLQNGRRPSSVVRRPSSAVRRPSSSSVIVVCHRRPSSSVRPSSSKAKVG